VEVPFKLRIAIVSLWSRHLVGTDRFVEYFIDSSLTAFFNRVSLTDTLQTRTKMHMKVVKSIIPPPMKSIGIQIVPSTDTKHAAIIINIRITNRPRIEIKLNSISQEVDRRARLILAIDCLNSYGSIISISSRGKSELNCEILQKSI
jgi:hypothetical protein